MAIYLCLIGYIILLPWICNLLKVHQSKMKKAVALWGMLGIFLVLAFKSTSVGVDIIGYRDQYYIAKDMPWGDFSYVYFEKGYILLEKIFSKINISFQVFTMFIYGFSSIAWYKLISKYSDDPCLSLLFYVCFQFFVFSASGLRQTIAMAICALAFVEFDRFDVGGWIKGSLLSIAAISVHESAYVFLLVPVIIFVAKKIRKINIITVILLFAASIVLRTPLWIFVNAVMKQINVGAKVSLGGAFLFIVAVFAFSIFTYIIFYGGKSSTGIRGISNDDILYEDSLAIRLSLYAAVLYIALSGGVLLRGVMYITMFITIFFPRMISKYDKKGRIIIKIVFSAVLIYIFYSETLSVNQFEICPYKFFWER